MFHHVMSEKKPQEGELMLGVCAKGIIVYEVKDGCRSTSQNFYWRETATITSNVSRAILAFQIKLPPKMWFEETVVFLCAIEA